MALWLPKWLRTDAPPEPDNVHRRTFLMVGAAAAAAALLPSPPVLPWDGETFQGILYGESDGVYRAGYHAVDRDAFVAYYRRELLLRTANPRYHFRLDGITAQPTQLVAVEVPADAGVYIAHDTGRWEDKDGNALFKLRRDDGHVQLTDDARRLIFGGDDDAS